jgi:glycosyltransferase involved in cell wall biosynthesis
LSHQQTPPASKYAALEVSQFVSATAGEKSKPAIRVAQLLHTMAHGGVETAILNWNLTLNRERIDSRLLCFSNPNGSEQAFVDAAVNHGFTVGRIPWSRSKPVLRAARAVAAFVRRERIDVLHCHNTYANLVGLVASKLAPVKTVTTMYVWGKFGFKRDALQWIDRHLMKRFDKVSAHCESCFRDTVQRGIAPEALDLLICGYPSKPTVLSASERERKRLNLGAPADVPVLIYMARFWPEKAHDNLLSAFQLVLARYPACRLWLPGVGPELERIRALSETMGLTESVDFLGFRSDADELLEMADMQVHPSDLEGVALAVCAGMNAGLPIVATNVGGLPEVLKHNVNSILVPPRQPAALADAICGVLGSPETAQRLGREARRFVREEYSLEIATERLSRTYERLVERAS